MLSLKILYVITSLRIGGAEKLVTDLSLRLTEYGHSVDVFVMDGTPTPYMKQLEEKGVKIYKASNGYGQMWNIWHYKKLKKLIAKNKYDIVHAHNTAAQIITCLTGLSQKKEIRFVTTEHNTYNRRRRLPLFKIIDRKIYGFYEKVICVSDTTKDNLLRHLSMPMSDKKFVTITNGIDFSKFNDVKKDKPEKYKNKIIILMVAGFRRQKDQPTLIRALKYLPDEYMVWLAGEGSRKKMCEKLVKNLGLKDRVIFLGNRTDIAELYSMADIIVMASHYEGMPLSILEGLGAGKPYIASDVEGNRDIVADTGLLFIHKDPQSLSLNIKKVNEDKNLYTLLSGLSLRKIQNFDIKKTVFHYEKLYLGGIDSRLTFS